MFLRKAGPISEAFDLRLHILKVDLLVGDKVPVILEELAAVDGQEFQFPQQNIGAFFDAREQVHQLGIQVVINVQSVWVRRQRQQHRADAAQDGGGSGQAIGPAQRPVLPPQGAEAQHQQDTAQRGQDVVQVQELQRQGLQGDAPYDTAHGGAP